jgi:PAS domain S-box-containing protein
MDKHSRGAVLKWWQAALACAPLPAYAAASDGASAAFVIVFALLASAAATLWALQTRGQLHRMEERIRSHAGTLGLTDAGSPAQGDGTLAALERLLEGVERRVLSEHVARTQAETRLHESQERYALAVQGATDGLWEWNFETHAAYFSPRAKALLGYADDEIGHAVAEWRARIHPDDLRHALRQLRAYVEGGVERFEVEHRMRHRDGSWRWVLARAVIVRHASGKPDRLIGLYSDISPRKRVQQVIIDLAEGLSGLQGEACLQALVQRFAEALRVREAFVCECIDYPTTRVRMLARWKGAEPARCVEFDLAGTACEHVIGYGKEVFVPTAAGQRWPLEALFERDSYLGLPCYDSRGRVVGHVACADPGQMPEDLPHRAVLKLFALRAALEIERRQLRGTPSVSPPQFLGGPVLH